MLQRLREATISIAAPALAVCALVFGATRLGALEDIDLLLHDLMTLCRLPSAAPSRVTLIAITEKDLGKIKGHWPISDDQLAEVLEKVAGFGPRVVGIDIYRDKPVEPASGKLPSLLAAHPEIVMPRKFPETDSPGVAAPSYLPSEQIGCSDVVVDPDGYVRRGLLYLSDDTRSCPALALQVALRYLAHDGIGAAPDERDAEILQLGNRRFIPFNANDGGYVGADANGYQFLLDLRDLLATSPRYNLDQLLNGPIRPEDFHDQVVLIGVDAESLKDHFRVLRTPAGQFNAGVPGVALHGIIASQILRAAVEGEGPLHGVAESHEVLWLLLWCALGASISRQPRQPLGLTAVALAGTAADFAVGQALMIGDAWLPLAPSLAGWWLAIATNTALVARREYQQRRLLNRLFGLHVDTRIAAEIWANRTAICQGGRIPPQKLVATIFFSDLQGFTQIAETLEPDLFITWLNEYLDAMTTVIQRHDGVVIRFIGDAILAGFGVPVTRRSEEEIARDALNACRCALEIQRILMQMNQNWAARGLPSAAMRIGINTGPVLAGSLGNQDRLEYTVHGDVVNTAARLEQIEKDRFAPAPLERPCRMLIGGQTQTHVAAHINHRFLGPMVVKGKSLAVDVYELHGEEAAHPQAMGIADSQQGAVGVAPKNKPSP